MASNCVKGVQIISKGIKRYQRVSKGINFLFLFRLQDAFLHAPQPHVYHSVGNRWARVHIYNGQVIFAGQSPYRLATTVKAPAISNFVPSSEKFHGLNSGSVPFAIFPSRHPNRDPLGVEEKIQIDWALLLVTWGGCPGFETGAAIGSPLSFAFLDVAFGLRHPFLVDISGFGFKL